MAIASIAEQLQTNFDLATKPAAINPSNSISSSLASTSNDRTTLQQQEEQVQTDIQRLQGGKGSFAKIQKPETSLQDIQKRLSELSKNLAPQSHDQIKMTEKTQAEQTRASQQASENTLTKPNDITPAVATYVGTQLDIYT